MKAPWVDPRMGQLLRVVARAVRSAKKRLWVEQRFRNYRFFSVRAAGEIRAFIQGDGKLSRP